MIRSNDIVLEVEGLQTLVATERGMVSCVNGADLTVGRGETLGLVGESGCGKTMAARSIMGLVEESPGVVGGRMVFRPDGLVPVELTAPLSSGQICSGSSGLVAVQKNARRWKRAIREIYQPLWGRHLSMIFQDPQTALNPYWSVGAQLGEAVTIGHREAQLSANALRRSCLRWLERVQIGAVERVYDAHPHELSGGMCQRVMIAIALASRPDLVIADEPTTGLDVTIQAHIVELFKELREELGLTMLLISHDIGLIGQLSDRVAVMYCGRVVECGSREEVLIRSEGRHPYAEALLNSLPTGERLRFGGRLPTIADAVPDPLRQRTAR